MKWIDDDYDSDEKNKERKKRKEKKNSFTHFFFIIMNKRQESIFNDYLPYSINDANPRYTYVYVKQKMKELYQNKLNSDFFIVH